MLIQTQKKSKTQTPLIVLLLLVGGVTAVVAYRTYFGGTDIDINADIAIPTATISPTFDTKVLEDVRVRGLRQNGAPEVLVNDRGRKPDPFAAF